MPAFIKKPKGMTKGMKKNLTYAALCLVCGYAMCVPGLSGGSVAILLGIYKKMMEIAAGFLTKPKKYLFPLLVTGAFCLCGAFLFSFFPGKYAETHERAFTVASAVMVAFSLPFYIKNSKIKRLNAKALFYIVLGVVLVLCADLALHAKSSPVNQGFGPLSYFLAGFVLSAALVLPGISYPYMLSFIGIYGAVMGAAATFDMQILLPLGLGTVIGIVALSKGILKVMENFAFETDSCLLGFTVASAAVMLF